MTCRGLCDSNILKLKLKIIKGGGRGFPIGFKLCTLCQKMFETTDIHCPCCGCQLRATPRSNQNGLRDKYLEKINIKRM